MSNEVFPTLAGLGWGVTKTPVFNTKIQAGVSGFETRAMLRVNPLWRVSMSFEYLSGKVASGVADIEALMGFFTRHRGSFDSFLFDDKNDNSEIDQAIGVGNGSLKTFQIVRTFGGFTEPVTNIKTITNIKVAGVVKTLGTHYSVGSNGVITFVTAPTAGQSITWTGGYYYRARFADDTMDFENVLSNIWSAKKVDLLATLGSRI